MRTDLTEYIKYNRRVRNSRVQVWLYWMIIVVIFGGFFALIEVESHYQLYIASPMYGGWRGTFEYASGLVMVVWATCFFDLRVNDEEHYRMTWWGRRIRRTPASEVVILTLFPAIGLAWGLVVHDVLSARATSANYLEQLPYGTSPGVLSQGVVAVTIGYYAIVAIVLLIILVCHRFNPVDLDEYAAHIVWVVRRGKE